MMVKQMNRLNHLEKEAERMKSRKTDMDKKPQQDQELLIVDTDNMEGRLKTDLDKIKALSPAM